MEENDEDDDTMKSSIQDIISNENFNNNPKHTRVASCSSSPCCRTEAMTIATSPSNSSSEEVKVDDEVLLLNNNDKPLSEVIANCLICFWPMHNMDVGDEQEPQPRNDCFVAVNDWHDHHASSNTFNDTPADNSTFYQAEQNTTTDDDVHVIGTLPLHHQSTGNNCKFLLDNDNKPARRLTPNTIQTQSRTSLTEKNGATLMSNNTLHRRTDDISVGFFTNQTLDEINVGGDGDGDGEDDYQIGTPRCQPQQQNNHRVVYQTPGNRVRIDSESFRRTIKVVTCEKRRISDESDVSPIASDTGFNLSPMIDYTKHKRVAAVESVESLLSSQSAVDSPQKRLVFDKGEGWIRLSDAPPPDDGGGDGKSLLVYDNGSTMPPESSSPLSPISEFGMSVMKSLQSIIQGGSGSRLTSSPITTPSSYAKKNDDVSRHTPTSTRTDEQQLWQDCFLPKSSTFLKALRRSGRRGKVLIQGWVAFRENNNNLSAPAWKEIIRNPQRCDFRYIILLDDIPTLHIFSSRRKQKKKKKMVVSAMQSKPDVLRDCIHLNLSTGNEEDLAVRVNFVSKELGNEVCIFEKETGVECYSFLPIPIPSNVFIDKHRSRLAKGEVLEGIFERCMSSSVLELESPSNADANVMDSSKSTMTIDYLRASVQQYDVSRHLLFVLDAVAAQ